MARILWDKFYTETLAKTLERFRNEYPEYQSSKVTYAGRLDPMAEGLLLLLTDEDVHKKEEFLRLDKVYEVDFFLGIETDTYDILGLITHKTDDVEINKEKIKEVLAKFVGKHHQDYPAYSSKTVDGKALWKHSRELNDLQIEIPKAEREVYESGLLGIQELVTHGLEQQIIESVEKVSGDFRQEKIIEDWKDYFKNSARDNCTLYTARFKVSSGTYIRSLVSELGKRLGTGAVSIKIKRTQIGKDILT